MTCREIELIGRWSVDITEMPLPLEPTERRVWLSRTVRGQVSGILGCSTGDVDIVVTDDFLSPRAGLRWAQIVEICAKRGKYDDTVRARICFRRLPEEQAAVLRPVTVDVSCDDHRPYARVSVRDAYPGLDWDATIGTALTGLASRHRPVPPAVLWTAEYRRHSHEVTDPDRAGDIVLWHWQRYYRMLPWADVEPIVVGFATAALGMTLSAANRLASRELYAAARAAGWHKLTLREQQALGLRGQWHTDAAYAAAWDRRRDEPTGTSDATLRAATRRGNFEPLVEAHDRYGAS